jgi:hypothetical protein
MTNAPSFGPSGGEARDSQRLFRGTECMVQTCAVERGLAKAEKRGGGKERKYVRHLRVRASARHPTLPVWRARARGTKGVSDRQATNRPYVLP